MTRFVRFWAIRLLDREFMAQSLAAHPEIKTE